MKVNQQLKTISYKYQNPMNTMSSGKNSVKTPDINNGHVSLRRMIAEATKEQNNAAIYSGGNNIISNAMSYSQKLKEQRESVKDASLEKKKLRYQFKDISSQIIRSKSSHSARKAVGAARREVLRLKQEKNSGKYDSEEIDAAIAHAKAMERVAKKKVKHLEEEEMLKAAGGPCADYIEEQKEKLEKDNGALSDEELEQLDREKLAYEDEYDYGAESDFEADFEEVSLEELEAMMSQMAELSSDLMDEVEEGMREMLEEMGFDELTDSLSAAKGDMDPADLKMMKIKHRNKEMKEMVKADAEYLKALFEHFEKIKNGGGAPTSGGAPAGGRIPISSGAAVGLSSISAGTIPNCLPSIAAASAGMGAAGGSAIDISI